MPGQTASNSAPNPSDENPSTRPADWFALAGTSHPPDPATHAYRKDLADVALAGRVIASHYAEPMNRHLVTAAPLLSGSDESAEVIATLQAGDAVRMLDNSRGWAWIYAPDGRVGYVRSAAVGV